MIDANPIIERFNSRVFGYILLVLVVVFHSLVIAGCMSKSSGIPGLYIVKLQISNSSSVQVRVGYFAMCVNGPLNSPYECYSTTGLGQDKLRSFFITENMDATTSSQISQLLVPARAMQTRVFPPLIAGAFGCFMASVMLAAALAWWLNDMDPQEDGIYISEGTGMQVLQWLIVSMIILYHLCFAHLFTDKKKGVEEKAEAPAEEA
ncbi:Ca2+ regulator and membrane fusion protein Fig1 [Ceratocystis platani]|uniref:Ca2+ regulator and membrane fusion protein Fig1 n=1 Tax=Ceratocystis fimbriata f. sp. platani TaxID=88771 RepID=A0A0F8DDB0_CERFI|nr:Ca2+ regulator and membrane fusion protein Fig1 [Ceratocystis platani]